MKFWVCDFGFSIAGAKRKSEIKNRKLNSSTRRYSASAWVVGIVFTIVLLAACQTQPNQVFIEVDGSRQTLTTEAATVRQALDEADVELSPLDRVKPDLYVQLEPGLTIVVTRVREEIITEREIIPFERQTIVNEAFLVSVTEGAPVPCGAEEGLRATAVALRANEALASGETRLAQLGVNGEEEVSIRIVYENGQEVSRTEVSRATVIEPVPEILVVGPQDTLPPVPVSGTITYISNGNAWLMRNSSSSRRALTTEGRLDGRVFSLSPTGRHLLYTTELTDEIDLPLNDLWLASTTIVGEKPITLGIQGVLQAEWSPVVTASLVAYSTAQRTANPPGWQANNDLWLFSPPLGDSPAADEPFAQPVQILPPNTQGLYPWWGTTFIWSPDGAKLAYARADQVGVIDLAALLESAQEGSTQAQATPGPSPDNFTTPLLDFVPLQTFSNWVWVPGISWSPDGKFIAATVHGPPLTSEPAEESQVFDLWLISADGSISARVAEQVGMWANPAWSKAGIAFGQAVDPLQSVNSRYHLQVVDKDGSNKRQIFPFREELGVQLPELVWSPEAENLLFVYNGNLHITRRDGGLPKQLSTDGRASHPRWAPAPSVTITGTTSITATGDITSTGIITPTPTAAATATATPQPATPTRTATPSPAATLQTSTPPPTATQPRPTATPSPTRTPTVQDTPTSQTE